MERCIVKKSEYWNIIKGLAIVGSLVYGGFLLLCSSDKPKDNGPEFEYVVAYTTINGHLYEKEATSEDLNLYISRRLGDHRVKKRVNKALSKNIVDKLQEGAKGM